MGKVGSGLEWFGLVQTISLFRFLNKIVQILGHDTVSFWVRHRIFLSLGGNKSWESWEQLGKTPTFYNKSLICLILIKLFAIVTYLFI